MDRLNTTRWRSDLHLLLREVQGRRPTLFSTVPDDAFIATATRLDRRLPDLTDADVTAEMTQLISMIHLRPPATGRPSVSDHHASRRLPMKVYDFADGGEADGWLHGLFRYEDKLSGHVAETSFGAHVFNTVLTYKGEPQSYAGRAPGLSTRLFLRLGDAPLETLCHLIYPASTPWHETSATTLILHDQDGTPLAEHEVNIACGGSLLWTPADFFSAAEMKKAGPAGYVIIRDTTCRLFGYHGLTNGEKAFRHFEQFHYDLCLLDVMMPEMDGIELLQQIKRENPETEVVMITGHGDMDLAIKSLKYEATDFVTKPINDEVLEIALNRAVERITMRQKLSEYTHNLEQLVQDKTRQLVEAERLASVGQTVAGLSHAIKNITGRHLFFTFLHDIGLGNWTAFFRHPPVN